MWQPHVFPARLCGIKLSAFHWTAQLFPIGYKFPTTLCNRIPKHSAKMATGDIRQSEGSQNSIEIDDLARFAVDEHNKKQNALLEFKNVKNVKQQVVSGTMYYITLEAADGGKKKEYEAKVWVKPWMNFKEVQEFKHVGDA